MAKAIPHLTSLKVGDTFEIKPTWACTIGTNFTFPAIAVITDLALCAVFDPDYGDDGRWINTGYVAVKAECQGKTLNFRNDYLEIAKHTL